MRSTAAIAGQSPPPLSSWAKARSRFLLRLAVGFLFGVGFLAVRFFIGRLLHGVRGFFFAFLITFAAVIRFVKTAALKNDSRAGANHPRHLALAPFAHAATLLRARLQVRCLNGLKMLKLMSA